MSKSRLMIVGSFPKKGDRTVVGGIATSCLLLQESSLREIVHLETVDLSTAVDGTHVIVRVIRGLVRNLDWLARITRRRPDAAIIFCSSRWSMLEKGVMAWSARLFGARVLISPRGGTALANKDRILSRWLSKFALSAAHKVICQGEGWVRYLEHIGIPRDRGVIVYNWTATPTLLEVGANREYTRLPGPVRFLFVGAIHEEKGVLDLVEAIQMLPEHVDVEVRMVGAGPRMGDVSARILGSGRLRSTVSLLGQRVGDDLIEQLRWADAFVFPSWIEGMPNAVVEAAAAGLPIVCTSVGVVPDVFEDGTDICLVPPRSPGDLADAIAGIALNRAARENMGKAAYLKACATFSVDNAVCQILKAAEIAV